MENEGQIGLETKPKKLKLLPILLVILFAAIIGAGSWFYVDAERKEKQAEEDKAVQETTDSSQSTTTDSGTTSSATNSPATATTDETKDWTSYTSTELGLIFKYPKAWGDLSTAASNSTDNELIEGKNFSVIFNEQVAGGVTGFSSDYRGAGTFDSGYAGNQSNLDAVESSATLEKLSFTKKITVAGVKTHYTGRFDDFRDIADVRVKTIAYLNGRNDYKGIEISCDYSTIAARLQKYPIGSNELKENAKKELDALERETTTDMTALAQYREFKTWLTTFQFASPDSSATADWNTYNSTTYGFSFKYPKDWTISEAKLDNTLAYITISSAKTTETHKSGGSDLPSDIGVTVYENINQLESSYKSNNLYRNITASNNVRDFLDKFASASDPVFQNISDTTIGNKSGYAANAGPNQYGGGQYHFINLKNGNILKLWDFAQDDLTKSIRDSFSFTN